MDAPPTPSSLFLGTQELPADVILIILKDLHEIQQISNLRVVSKQFDALVTPLSYRHVHLTDRIVAPFALQHEMYDPSIVQLQVARDVSNHARRITINRNLDWSLVAKLIRSLKNLRSFTWAFWGPEATSLFRSANSTIGRTLCETWPNVQLHFEGVCSSTYRPRDYSEFPTSNLVTCKVAAWETSEFPYIKELLFERPRLQKLYLVNGGSARSASPLITPKSEIHRNQIVKHLPALKVLIVDGYNWNHSLWEGFSVWNWFKITHLELRNVQVISFLHRVPPQCLSGLKIFVEKDTCDSVESYHKKKSRLLSNLVKHTTALEELEIKCDTQDSEIISSIAQNGSHLRTLSLRCLKDEASSLQDLEAVSSWWKPLTVDQLKTIGPVCPQLTEMKVDLAWPRNSHTSSASSSSRSRMAIKPISTVMTRSMKRNRVSKRDATDTNRDGSKDGGVEGSRAQREIPSWYIDAYLKERFLNIGLIGWRRVAGLREMVREHGIEYRQANDEYEIWKRNRRQEDVATLRNQVHANPAPALAAFRNLRRLTIFTRISHFVAPAYDKETYARTRGAVKEWLNELLLMKDGADFEEVVVHVKSDVVNEDFSFKPRRLESRYTYAGSRYLDGRANIHEEIGPA